MAVVSPHPAVVQQVHSSRFSDNRVSGNMSERDRIVEDPVPVARLIEDTIYVAVGKDVKECKSTLLWALQNSGGRKLCILHVHEPPKWIPMPEFGTKLPASSVEKQRVEAYRIIERQNMLQMLNDYLVICNRAGVSADKCYIETDNIEKGIVELVYQHGIKKLVMGAAADKHYSRKMTELKSKKAIYVRSNVPASCHLWFICKGYSIHTRKGTVDGVDLVARLPLLSVSSETDMQQSQNFRSQSVHVGQNNNFVIHQRARSENCDSREVPFSPDLIGHTSNAWSGLDTEESSNESSSRDWGVLSRSSAELLGPLALGQSLRNVGSQDSLAQSGGNHCFSSPSLAERQLDGELYDLLKNSVLETEISKQNSGEELVRCKKGENEAIEAFQKAKTSETSYVDELKRKMEIDVALAGEKEKLGKIKSQRDEVMKELQVALDQKSLLESQISKSDEMVKELEAKIISAVELLQKYKRERDELQIEHDNALKEAEELRKQHADEGPASISQYFSEFTFSEIEEATQHFNPSLKIGEGGYGSIYRGVLRHTQVAIKTLHANSLQGPSEYQREVDVLSNLRHPNLVMLIGACPATWTLIYEYLPNGSLEDHLSCKDNTAPLSWQTRICIAAELCSVLIFLHNVKPHGIVHSDLKPSNILLDGNFVSKLSDFGICRVMSLDGNSTNNTSFCWTAPKGTVPYMDPEFLVTGELTPQSDVYSFGIILLRLLTGRSAMGITKEVQYALDKGNLGALLDPLAGDWPFVQAKQLAHLAMRCCEMNRKSRPDLALDVWIVLDAMKSSSGASLSFCLISKEHGQIPRSYVCPIFQEVMHDPHVAADGYTYEAEAIRGWLDGGHDTSPMTGLRLAHLDLVPNRALRSAIQEWLQQS